MYYMESSAVCQLALVQKEERQRSMRDQVECRFSVFSELKMKESIYFPIGMIVCVKTRCLR